MLAGTLRKHKRIRMLARFLRIMVTDLAFSISFRGNAFLLLVLWLRNRFSKEDIVLISLTETYRGFGSYRTRIKISTKGTCRRKNILVVDKKYRSLIECNPNIDRAITVSCFAEWIFLRQFARVAALCKASANAIGAQ
jgi:hypothetical protein